MKILSPLIAIILLAMISLSQGFPLQTSDGKVAIYGMIPFEGGFALDMYSPAESGESPASSLAVQIVDLDDRFIKSTSTKILSQKGPYDRALYLFKSDKPATQIKRIRIETPDQQIYSIPWSGVPEISTKNISMRLYGITDVSESYSYEYEHDRLKNYKWYNCEVKITNNMSNDLDVSSDDFILVDQFNYAYRIHADDDYKLLPGEAIRYNLTSAMMSPISRPKLLIYKPANLTMDLEGWY